MVVIDRVILLFHYFRLPMHQLETRSSTTHQSEYSATQTPLKASNLERTFLSLKSTSTAATSPPNSSHPHHPTALVPTLPSSPAASTAQ